MAAAVPMRPHLPRRATWRLGWRDDGTASRLVSSVRRPCLAGARSPPGMRSSLTSARTTIRGADATRRFTCRRSREARSSSRRSRNATMRKSESGASGCPADSMASSSVTPSRTRPARFGRVWDYRRNSLWSRSRSTTFCRRAPRAITAAVVPIPIIPRRTRDRSVATRATRWSSRLPSTRRLRRRARAAEAPPTVTPTTTTLTPIRAPSR